MGSLALNYVYHMSPLHDYNWVTATVAGLSVYVSLLVSKKWLKLNDDLSQFTLSQLMGVCVVFSVISPLMHQIWYGLDGETPHFWSSLLAMVVGDASARREDALSWRSSRS